MSQSRTAHFSAMTLYAEKNVILVLWQWRVGCAPLQPQWHFIRVKQHRWHTRDPAENGQ